MLKCGGRDNHLKPSHGVRSPLRLKKAKTGRLHRSERRLAEAVKRFLDTYIVGELVKRGATSWKPALYSTSELLNTLDDFQKTRSNQVGTERRLGEPADAENMIKWEPLSRRKRQQGS